MPRHNKELDRAIVKQVLGYFMRNPKATDTLEGVARWRLLEERIHENVRQTKEAIDWLVEEGYLEKVVPPGGNEPVYRMKVERKGDAVRLFS